MDFFLLRVEHFALDVVAAEVSAGPHPRRLELIQNRGSVSNQLLIRVQCHDANLFGSQPQGEITVKVLNQNPYKSLH